MRGFGEVLCLFVCSWVLVFGGVWFLVEYGKFISIIFTFVRVGAIAKLSSVGNMYIISVCVGAIGVQLRNVSWWVLGDVRVVS